MTKPRNSTIGRTILGLYLILIGGLLFTSNLGFEIPRGIWSYWPFLLIAGGGAKLAFGGDRDSWGEGFWLMLSGLYCWISVWNLWGLSWGTAWPIFVVAGGLSMVLDNWLGGGSRNRCRKPDGEERGADHVA